jgi:hypothetical protein
MEGRAMTRSDINPMPEYYDRYIMLVEDIELADAFEESMRQINAIDRDRLEALKDKTYAPGKWGVKDILQHLNDIERIHCYRTLMYARQEPTIPAQFESELLARNAKSDMRTIAELIAEHKAIRLATIAMFRSFDRETLLNIGISWKYKISVLAEGFFVVGHQQHHLKVIEEKYYPLLARR